MIKKLKYFVYVLIISSVLASCNTQAKIDEKQVDTKLRIVSEDSDSSIDLIYLGVLIDEMIIKCQVNNVQYNNPKQVFARDPLENWWQDGTYQGNLEDGAIDVYFTDQKECYEIIVYDGEFETRKGIRIGSTLEETISTYGKPDMMISFPSSEVEAGMIDYNLDKYSLRFAYEDNSITSWGITKTTMEFILYPEKINEVLQ